MSGTVFVAISCCIVAAAVAKYAGVLSVSENEYLKYARDGTDIYGKGPDAHIHPNAHVYNPYFDPITRHCKCNQHLVEYSRQHQIKPRDDFLQMMDEYRRTSGIPQEQSLVGVAELPKCANCHGGQDPNFHYF